VWPLTGLRCSLLPSSARTTVLVRGWNIESAVPFCKAQEEENEKMRPLSIVSVFLGVGLVLAGCSDDAMPPGPDGKVTDLLPPPRAGEGVQLKMVSTLAAGTETERCMFYQVPPEGLYVNRQEVRYSPGSHHVLVYLTPYTEIPTKNLAGEEVDTRGVFECGNGGPTANWTVNGVVGGAQKADAPPVVEGLPADTAMVVPGGSVLMMNTHYLNASTRPLETDARINLYLIPKAQVTREAGIIFFYNPFIHVPGQSRASARMSCPIRKDITLLNSQSHMHKRGVDYVAYLTDAEGNRLDELYRTKEWEEVILRKFEAGGKRLTAGQQIDFQCGYDNKEDRTVIQGLSTTDEMCMFLGLYYPRDAPTEFCALDEKAEAPYLAGRWIGSGTADGSTTADCLTRAMNGEGGEGAMFGCVVGSCEKISAPMSESARCLVLSGSKCEAECKSGGDACGTCMRAQCEEPLNQLTAASCN
jgi:hypothetical protein